ncbi:double-strand-break repair protein rad21-like protein 1 isoform X1 [Entelurus aequoreus]|uniref:double-strand-break repair protein rad21-like protein 1 isoform X1 n=1 Tax=Entelurus aequoreus TaxID=161455 RepID=UPI002B1DDE32|nr:double-strand-break repair protein rad21-like protein 1 isoform X1 [Entelurus aequoreus]XP_061909426.1 double-strand-break repair protein rad21-like protein 1 isoform X1 [Entelurus aequoreus]XP_061909427.1 double-strand-break repair protein rad21-like protein 1 isoform X1 [Entelurus aequoreus]
MFNFYTHALTPMQGSLTKIWLAAHWKQKITKDHVFECNLEKTIGDIISPQMQIGLRTSGYLLLGVVRIFSRKTKYLLADCTLALVKIKVSFRPDETQLPVEELQATVQKITLTEDFTSFNDQLLHPNDVHLDLNYFSLHQSRPEEITLKEDFGNSFLSLADIGDESKCVQYSQIDISFQSLAQNNDSFGDEGTGRDLLDFLTCDSDYGLFTVVSPQELFLNNNSDNTLLNNQHGASRLDPAEEESLNQLSNEQLTFALTPVFATSSPKKKRRRKSRLIVDQITILTNIVMQEQLSDSSDLISPIDMAPPTRNIMLWKESGAADKLLAQPCTNIIAPQIKENFKNIVYLSLHDNASHEVMRQDDVHRNTLNTERLVDLSRDHKKLTDTLYSSDNQADVELTQDEHISDLHYPEILSEDSLFVHPSHVEQYSQARSTNSQTQSLLGSQDFEAQRLNRQAQMLLKSLQRTSETQFSLKALCAGSTRSQATATFYSLLVLQKQQSVNLQQSAPYEDILVTLGSAFFLR